MPESFENEVNPEKIKKAEMVVCIPSYKEADSISYRLYRPTTAWINISRRTTPLLLIVIITLLMTQSRSFLIPRLRHQRSIFLPTPV